MKALVLNAIGSGFDLEDVDIAAPIGREVLVDVRASGLCHMNDGYASLKGGSLNRVVVTSF